MNQSVRENYLMTDVMTATPQKLQLMLIDAAIRAGEQTRLFWQQQRLDDACESLIKCQRLVTELLCGLNPEANRELARKAAGVYLFVFRRLSEAQMNRSEESLAEAMSVLDIERETWRQVCEKLGTRRTDAPVAAASQGAVPAPSMPAPTAPVSAQTSLGGTSLTA
ncbi:MAG: flagellar export chaperone FliS [Pirellulales bacterium]